MTKLLSEVMRKVVELPESRQDDAAHILLTMLENDRARYRLSDEQLREVEIRVEPSSTDDSRLRGRTANNGPKRMNKTVRGLQIRHVALAMFPF